MSPVMEQPARSPSMQMVYVLGRMSARARAGDIQDPIALAEAQERGFGVLIAQEAQLQRVLAASGGAESAEAQSLQDSIATLREALAELRRVLGGDRRSEATYGFVLPRTRGRAAASAESISPARTE